MLCVFVPGLRFTLLHNNRKLKTCLHKKLRQLKYAVAQGYGVQVCDPEFRFARRGKLPRSIDAMKVEL